MASLSLSGFTEYLSWTISGLSSAFNQTNYTSAGVSRGVPGNGTYTAPSGILDSISPPANGSAKSCGGSFNCAAGSYTLYGWVTDSYGRYYSVGSATATVKANTPTYGNGAIYFSSGIASVKYAYIDANGSRHPNSGYNTAYSDWSVSNIRYFYVDSITLKSGYELPWNASYGGRYTQGSTSDYTSGTTLNVRSTIYPESGYTASITLSATQSTGGNVSVGFGSGVASLQVAYRTKNGTRHPTSGYSTLSSGQLYTGVEMVYIYSVSFSSPYGTPWNASYSGSYTSETSTSRTSGTTSEVNALIYPVTGATAYFTISGTLSYDYYVYWCDLYYSAANPWKTSSATNVSTSTYSFTAPTPSRTGYTFDGWCASYSGKNGTGSIVVGGGEDINLPYNNQRSITLYARWTVHTYSIYFNANGGSGSMSSLTGCMYPTSYTLPKNQFTRTQTITYNYGYTGKADSTEKAVREFTYWTCNGSSYADQATVQGLTTTDGGSVTMYAQWGSYSVSLPNPIRSGYTFKGWYDASGNYVGAGNSTLTGTTDRTLYAHWVVDVIAPTISYSSHTDTSITISLSRNGATSGSWVVEVSRSNSFGSLVTSQTISSTTQASIRIDSLSPNTTYYIRVRHVNGTASAASNTLMASTRISQFQWTSNDAVNIVAGQDFSTMILASKWNELIDKVNWCLQKSGKGTSGMSDVSAGSDMTAARFNAMRNAIASMNSSVVASKSIGDEIKAAYFANASSSLRTTINAIIVTL